MAGTANFSVEKGDTFLRNITFRNKSTGTPVVITGATITAFIEKSNVKVADLVGTVTNGAVGQFTIGMTSTNTALLTADIYQIEVKITFVDTSVKTLITGNFVVTD